MANFHPSNINSVILLAAHKAALEETKERIDLLIRELEEAFDDKEKPAKQSPRKK